MEAEAKTSKPVGDEPAGGVKGISKGLSNRDGSQQTSARAAVAVIFGTILYFFILVLALFVLDRQIYTTKKMDIIRNSFSKIIPLPDTLNYRARDALFSYSSERRVSALEELKKEFQKIADGDTAMYRLSLVDENGKEILSVDNSRKQNEFNTFQNNLFSRSFSSFTSMNIRDTRGGDAGDGRPGQIIGKYTSPKGVDAIKELTVRYRGYAFIIILAWVGVYWVLYFYLLRPVRNVTSYLEFSRNGVPRLIPLPKGPLEQGYNDLAANAVLQQIEETISDASRPDGEDTWGGLQHSIARALNLIAEAFRIDVIHAATVAEVHGKYSVSETFAGKGTYPVWEDFLSNQNVIELLKNNASDLIIEKSVQGSRIVSVGLAGDSPLLVYLESRFLNMNLQQNRFYLEKAMEALRSGISAHEAWQHHVFRQRSEANIVLSRNLGHDLTNIIATSKLELMAVKKILDNPEKALDGPRGQILSQGVSGLLESTKLLQEMVNIYRSFSYVKRPAYERRSLSSVVNEFVSVFAPAMSTRVEILVSAQDDIPSPIVEPRLLKLAIFNVLQNALDAFKRVSDDKDLSPKIIVNVLYDAPNTLYKIQVRDNGPGIRKVTGELMSPAETQAIFDYGFSTRVGEGEGLGLSWVRTIMEDFHDGSVNGENVADGAMITLSLKSMERVEARV